MSMNWKEYKVSRGIEISEELKEEANSDIQRRINAHELKEVRKALHLTQKQLSSEMGVSQKRISELENGKLMVLKLDTLKKYVSGLGGELEINIKLDDKNTTIQLV